MTIESTASSIVKNQNWIEGMNESHAYFKFEPGRRRNERDLGFDANLGNNPFFRLDGKYDDGMFGGIFEGGLNDLKKLLNQLGSDSLKNKFVIPVDSAK